MKKNKIEKIKSNRYVKWAVFILGLLFYAIMAVLPGVVFLFWSRNVSVLIIVPLLLIFPAILLLGYKQKLNAGLYLCLPVLIYTAIYIYLSTCAWHERIGINIASALDKTDGFGFLKNSSNYSVVPRLIFLGVSGLLLDSLYVLSFLKKSFINF